MKLKQQVELTSGRPGQVDQVFFTRGQRVNKDDLLIQLDDKELRARYATAAKKASSDIETRYAKKAQEVAEADLEAALAANLRSPGLVPAAEVRKLRLTAERSELQVEQAELQDAVSKLEVEEIGTQLEAYQVLSPISGYVADIHKEPGEGVQQGEVIVEIVNTDVLLAEGYVSVNDARQIQRGCRVSVAHRGLIYGGRIINVERQATFIADKVKVIAEFGSQPLRQSDSPTPLAVLGIRVLAGLKADMVIHTDQLMPEDHLTPQSETLEPKQDGE